MPFAFVVEDEAEPPQLKIAASKPSTDSPAEQVRLARSAHRVVPVPLDFKLDSYEERTLWERITSSRRAEDWRDVDLYNVYRIVQMQTEVDELTEILDKEGYVLSTMQAGLKLHPAFSARDKLQSQITRLMSTLSLTVGSDMAETMHRAKRRGEAAAPDEKPKRGRKGHMDLLA